MLRLATMRQLMHRLYDEVRSYCERMLRVLGWRFVVFLVFAQLLGKGMM